MSSALATDGISGGGDQNTEHAGSASGSGVVVASVRGSQRKVGKVALPSAWKAVKAAVEHGHSAAVAKGTAAKRSSQPWLIGARNRLGSFVEQVLGDALGNVRGFNPSKFARDVVPATARDITEWARILDTPPVLRSEEDIKHLDSSLSPAVNFLRKLPTAQRRLVFQRAFSVRLLKNETLFRQGDTGHTFFIVLDGLVNVNVEVSRAVGLDDLRKFGSAVRKPADHLKRNPAMPRWLRESLGSSSDSSAVTINTLGPMKEFGDMALAEPESKRQASVVAAENTLLLGINGREYVRLTAQYQDECKAASLNAIKSSVAFRNWPEASLVNLAELGVRKEVGPGATILEQGAPAESVVLVTLGQAQLVRRVQIPHSLATSMKLSSPATPAPGLASVSSSTASLKRSSITGPAALTHDTPATGVPKAPLRPSTELSADVRILHKGDSFGLADLDTRRARRSSLERGTSVAVVHAPTHSFSVVALTRVEVLLYPKQAVLELMKSDPGLAAASTAAELEMTPTDDEIITAVRSRHDWLNYKYRLLSGLSSSVARSEEVASRGARATAASAMSTVKSQLSDTPVPKSVAASVLSPALTTLHHTLGVVSDTGQRLPLTPRSVRRTMSRDPALKPQEPQTARGRLQHPHQPSAASSTEGPQSVGGVRRRLLSSFPSATLADTMTPTADGSSAPRPDVMRPSQREAVGPSKRTFVARGSILAGGSSRRTDHAEFGAVPAGHGRRRWSGGLQASASSGHSATESAAVGGGPPLEHKPLKPGASSRASQQQRPPVSATWRTYGHTGGAFGRRRLSASNSNPHGGASLSGTKTSVRTHGGNASLSLPPGRIRKCEWLLRGIDRDPEETSWLFESLMRGDMDTGSFTPQKPSTPPPKPPRDTSGGRKRGPRPRPGAARLAASPL